MDNINRIECNPDIMLGKPVIKGTRITVELIMKKLEEGNSIENILESYDQLIREDILAVIEYKSSKRYVDFEEMEAAISKLRYKLPDDYKFDRDEANER